MDPGVKHRDDGGKSVGLDDAGKDVERWDDGVGDAGMCPDPSSATYEKKA